MSTSWDPNSPSLRLAFVCYADILGFRDMTERAFKLGNEEEFLRRTKSSLNAAYEKVRNDQTLCGVVPAMFDVKIFTDNIVIAYPLPAPDIDGGEPELGSLLMLFSDVQADLATDGFFLRGAITVGPHYQDRDIVYGEALLEAVDLDKSGKPPRLVIGPSVEPLISEHLSWYGDGWAPHHSQLLEDPSDKRLFVNYLNVAFENFPDAPIDHELLAAHSKKVRKGLQKHESNESVLQKYRWLATYHDYVCRTFANEYSIGYDMESYSEEEISIKLEAQSALDYLVHPKTQPMEQPFRLLDAQRLKQRLDKI